MLNIQRRRHRGSHPPDPGSAPETEKDEPEPMAEILAPQPGLWLYLSVPIVGILLCGSKEPWALGILALLVGATAIFATPKFRLSPWVGVPLLAGIALCLAAFLPASWFPLPEWRVVLERDFGIAMAATRTPQPGVTLESWLAVAVCAVWLACCAARGFAPGERRRAVRALAFFVCLVACVAMVVRWRGIHVSFWRGSLDTLYFGPFPNRNLFSELLAVGAVLVFAATYDAFRRGQRFWILIAPAIIPIFAAILLNTSRTGVLIFFGGIGAWMFTAAFQKRSAQRVAVAAAILLIMAAVFLLFGGRIIQRFSPQNLSSDSRLGIFADTINMTREAPMLGVGLGNFEPVFALMRPQGDLYNRALHPENSWLLLAAEAGVPCLLLGILVLVLLVRRFGPWRTHEATGRRDRRVRNAAGIGVLLLCFAGMVDPAMHAPGFFALGCLLGGLALRTPFTRDAEAAPGANLMFKLAGAGCVVAGIAWLLIAAGIPVIRGNSVYRQLSKEALTLTKQGDASAALEKWNAAAAVKPLQWSIYYERALLKLQLGRTGHEALQDFARTRRLEPHSALICTHEFDEWLRFDPASGVPALREAMRRDPTRAVEFYRGRVHKVRDHPELRPHFRALAQADPKLLLAYLPNAEADEIPPLIENLLATHPNLETYTAEEMLRLFELWYRRGDAKELIRRLEDKGNTAWQRAGWSVLAAHKANEGDFRAAYEIARRHVPPTHRLPSTQRADVGDLARAFLLQPTDIIAGFNLYDAQRREAKFDEALATLDQLAKLPNAPASVLFERGETLSLKGNYAAAWEALRDYDQRLKRENAAR